jgi:hypothetical protein
MPNGNERDEILASLASREAASAAHGDIIGRHMSEKRQARLRIQAKIKEFWDEYKVVPLLAKPDLLGKRGLTDEGGRFVRSKVVELLRDAPLPMASPLPRCSARLGTSVKKC